MSIDISVSNSGQNNCNNIINILKFSGIDCRIIETTSIINNNIEKGCIITLDRSYSKDKLKNIWNDIKKSGNYNCAHLKIDGIFSGCIYNYIYSDFCPK
jgi:hypothetical protein